MTVMKSPGALAALGASEIDQLGGKVDPENSLRILTAQPQRPRAGYVPRCLACGSAINPRRDQSRITAFDQWPARPNSAIDRLSRSKAIMAQRNTDGGRRRDPQRRWSRSQQGYDRRQHHSTEHPRDRIAARIRARVFTGGRKRNQKWEESLADLAVKAGIDPDEAQYLFLLVYDEEKTSWASASQ